ncbi:MAG: hypothetical protein JWQ65_2793, partial [Devosia sp.]|nr:hypothetical protein [Devosia sp.]
MALEAVSLSGQWAELVPLTAEHH